MSLIRFLLFMSVIAIIMTESRWNRIGTFQEPLYGPVPVLPGPKMNDNRCPITEPTRGKLCGWILDPTSLVCEYPSKDALCYPIKYECIKTTCKINYIWMSSPIKDKCSDFELRGLKKNDKRCPKKQPIEGEICGWILDPTSLECEYASKSYICSKNHPMTYDCKEYYAWQGIQVCI